MLKAQEKGGHVDQGALMNSLNWSLERTTKILNQMVMDGVVWIDKQSPTGETWFWFPGLI